MLRRLWWLLLPPRGTMSSSREAPQPIFYFFNFFFFFGSLFPRFPPFSTDCVFKSRFPFLFSSLCSHGSKEKFY